MNDNIAESLSSLNPADAQYATRFVDILLAAGRERGASDLHLQPTPAGLELRWRVDGVLIGLGTYPSGVAANVIARLKVLADLLTYRNDLPQEGRIRTDDAGVEVRVSTFPTLHGERAVVRLFSSELRYRELAELQLPDEILPRLRALLSATSGAILVTGPAGSGKTTTLYACLHELVRASGGARSIVTLEDPIEVAVAGVAQSQINASAGFDLAAGLRSVLRQDPEVIMIGEIRDSATATVALQASLTGQLVLSSFHAGSAVEAIGRLLDMGIEPYMLRSGVLAIIFQRLVRKLCQCSRASRGEDELLGLPVREARVAVGCPRCAGSGYLGRTVLAEMLSIDEGGVTQAIAAGTDIVALEQWALRSGMVDRWQRALRAVETGLTSPAEVRRVLGFSKNQLSRTGF
ncbi:MAG TPA: GspE/PulE family protein [Pirellulales bacterium]|nr:GspE/PulE family protein [Pirellulales bacterium]